jgi:hypothetical protein
MHAYDLFILMRQLLQNKTNILIIGLSMQTSKLIPSRSQSIMYINNESKS